jgi:hypothetical protein
MARPVTTRHCASNRRETMTTRRYRRMEAFSRRERRNGRGTDPHHRDGGRCSGTARGQGEVSTSRGRRASCRRTAEHKQEIVPLLKARAGQIAAFPACTACGSYYCTGKNTTSACTNASPASLLEFPRTTRVRQERRKIVYGRKHTYEQAGAPLGRSQADATRERVVIRPPPGSDNQGGEKQR